MSELHQERVRAVQRQTRIQQLKRKQAELEFMVNRLPDDEGLQRELDQVKGMLEELSGAS